MTDVVSILNLRTKLRDSHFGTNFFLPIEIGRKVSETKSKHNRKKGQARAKTDSVNKLHVAHTRSDFLVGQQCSVNYAKLR